MKKELDLTVMPDDVRWTADQAEALVAVGMPRTMAITLASAECVDRIKDRAILRLLEEEDAAKDQRRARSQERHQEARASLTAKAVEGQRPTLKTSLGDLIARKKIG